MLLFIIPYLHQNPRSKYLVEYRLRLAVMTKRRVSTPEKSNLVFVFSERQIKDVHLRSKSEKGNLWEQQMGVD